MITNKDEAKAITEHMCNCKCKFNSMQNKKWNSKNYHKYEKEYSWNLAHVFVKIVCI